MNGLLERTEVRTTPMRWIVARQEQEAEMAQWVLPSDAPAVTILGFDSALDDQGHEKQLVEFELFNHCTQTEYAVRIAATEQGQWSVAMEPFGTVSESITYTKPLTKPLTPHIWRLSGTNRLPTTGGKMDDHENTLSVNWHMLQVKLDRIYDQMRDVLNAREGQWQTELEKLIDEKAAAEEEYAAREERVEKETLGPDY